MKIKKSNTIIHTNKSYVSQPSIIYIKFVKLFNI